MPPTLTATGSSCLRKARRCPESPRTRARQKPLGPKSLIPNEKEWVNINFKQGDVKIQMLVRKIQNKGMQPFCTTTEPRGGSKAYYSHIGDEFGIVLQGKLEINLNGMIYSIGKNESFYFSSQEPYGWANPRKRKTVVIWVVSPPTF